ncbi:MAG TPA: molybdopterin-binding protein [Anaeromyxobacteraceae bacterium]|nr:molybdopterin-binding protein [Anaeromyxobacteraceae bacterium]
MKTPTAAVIVVGNEVLSAKVSDENGPYAARALRARGVQLEVLLTLPDRLESIAEAVARERARVDWLFTAGGVGPTHDDVTLPAVARALGRGLVREPRLAANIRRWHLRHGAEPPPAALRMADVPEGTWLAGDPSFPVMVVENVVMLPGPPAFFQAQLNAFAETILAPPFRLAVIYLGLGEDHFATALDRVASDHPGVAIGSYPRFDDADHRVRVTFEAKDAALVELALGAFLAVLPPGALIRREGP